MKTSIAVILLLCALSAALFSLFGDNSYQEMSALERSVEVQRDRNAELEVKVQELRSVVRGVRSDPRVLEKAARNELGVARPNEKIFVFEKEQTANEHP